MLYTNVGLKKPELTDSADIRVAVGDNMDLLTGMVIPYGGTTTNVGNAYSLSSPAIGSLTVGIAVSFMVNVDSTGAATLNWDSTGAVAIKKPNGTDVTNLKANGIYTVRYNGTNFILQGSDSAGNATTGDVLASKTFSNDSGTDLTGTMPNRAGDTAALSSTVDNTTLKLLASNGYRDGTDDYVTITDADFVAENIKNGVDLFGKTGTFTNIKSIQHILVNFNSGTTKDVTITSVDTNKSLIILSVDFVGSTSASVKTISAIFTSSTNVQLVRGDSSTSDRYVNISVIEFYDIKSKQVGTVAGTSALVNTTISSVDPSKCILIVTNTTPNSSTNSIYVTAALGYLTNSTTLTTKGYDTTTTIYWQLLEFN